jgi:hypothetical protein
MWMRKLITNLLEVSEIALQLETQRPDNCGVKRRSDGRRY